MRQVTDASSAAQALRQFLVAKIDEEKESLCLAPPEHVSRHQGAVEAYRGILSHLNVGA